MIINILAVTVLPLLGILLIYISISSFKLNARIKKEGEQAESKVTNVIIKRSGRYSVYKPTVEYRTHEGIKTYTTSEASNLNKCKVGDIVKIIYIPNNPNLVRIDNPRNLFWTSLTPSITGVLLLTMSFAKIFAMFTHK